MVDSRTPAAFRTIRPDVVTPNYAEALGLLGIPPPPPAAGGRGRWRTTPRGCWSAAAPSWRRSPWTGTARWSCGPGGPACAPTPTARRG
ncbi:hypothetical protein NKH77_07415 [Streptomyces sp. M19]